MTAPDTKELRERASAHIDLAKKMNAYGVAQQLVSDLATALEAMERDRDAAKAVADLAAATAQVTALKAEVEGLREALECLRELVLESGSAAQAKANGNRGYRKFSRIRQDMLSTIAAALAEKRT